MAIEIKQTVQFGNIEAIEFECAICHTKIVYPVGRLVRPPINCFNCEEHEAKQWLIPGNPEYQDILALARLIQSPKTVENGRFVMRLVIAKTP